MYCYGMSKMTVKNELEKGDLKYYTLKPVEFYEYVGRLASVKFERNTSLSLAKKVEKTLDLILPLYNLQRNPVGEIEEPDNDSSDDSVIYDEVDETKILLE